VAARSGTAALTRTVLATSIGNLLEWYDFTVYAFFARYIAHSFFAARDPTVQLLNTFLVFGLGFIVRPLGAIIIGAYADRAGRKAALTLTILLMAAGTAVISVAPTYAMVGPVAAGMLLVGRLLQGFSAGGEIGGAIAFLLESAQPAARGRIAAWVQASMGMSNILGFLVGYGLTSWLSTDQLQAWGWRLPFVLGLLILPVGLYLRRSLEETQAFLAVSRRGPRPGGARRSAPLRQLLEQHYRALLAGLGVAVLWAVAVYVLMIYFPTYVQSRFGFSAQQAFAAALLGNAFFVTGCLAFGALSDYIGRRRSLMLASLALLCCIVPLFLWLEARPTFGTLLLVQPLICILVSSFNGVAPAALSEIFPTEVRASGISLVYNGAFTLSGGFAPTVLTWLTRPAGGAWLAPAWYVTLAALVAVMALAWLPRALAPRPAASVST
jgi:MHS family proline/betaine transporter-like MFS transporter